MTNDFNCLNPTPCSWFRLRNQTGRFPSILITCECVTSKRYWPQQSYPAIWGSMTSDILGLPYRSPVGLTLRRLASGRDTPA